MTWMLWRWREVEVTDQRGGLGCLAPHRGAASRGDPGERQRPLGCVMKPRDVDLQHSVLPRRDQLVKGTWRAAPPLIASRKRFVTEHLPQAREKDLQVLSRSPFREPAARIPG